MLKLHNILENFCIMILGFAVYETIYFDGDSKGGLTWAYLVLVCPLIIFTIYSIFTSARAVRILAGEIYYDLDQKKKFLFWTLGLSMMLEITVVVNAYKFITPRTGFLYGVGFLIGKLSMYSEVGSNWIVGKLADSSKRKKLSATPNRAARRKAAKLHSKNK